MGLNRKHRGKTSEQHLTVTDTVRLPADISVVGGTRKVKKFSDVTVTSTMTAENLSSWTLPTLTEVENVLLNVESKSTEAGTATFGTRSSDGDSDGFLKGVSLASTGLVQGEITATSTGGIESSATTLGDLLAETNTSADYAFRKRDITSGGQNITVTCASTGMDSFVGSVYILYTELS